MNLENYSLDELKRILDEIPRELERREAHRERAQKSFIWQDLEKVAAKQGYSLKRLFDEVDEQVQQVTRRK